MNIEIPTYVCTLYQWSTRIATQVTPNLMVDSWVHLHQRGETQVLPDLKWYHLIGSCPQEKHATVMSVKHVL